MSNTIERDVLSIFAAALDEIAGAPDGAPCQELAQTALDMGNLIVQTRQMKKPPQRSRPPRPEPEPESDTESEPAPAPQIAPLGTVATFGEFLPGWLVRNPHSLGGTFYV